jgi:predicted nucleic acid-binding protein
VILVDTSVWVDHLRRGHPRLTDLLDGGQVVGHSFVTGEIALGHLRQREEVLALLGALPQAARAEEDEVLKLIDAERLWGLGIGYVDAHLLAASRLSRALLWTVDRRLRGAASPPRRGIRPRELSGA